MFHVVFIFSSTLYHPSLASFLPFLLFPQMTFSNLARNQSFKRSSTLQFFVQKMICTSLYISDWIFDFQILLPILLVKKIFLFKFLIFYNLYIHSFPWIDFILILFNPLLTQSLHSILILFYSTLYLETSSSISSLI